MILNAGTLVTMDDDRTVREEVHIITEDGAIVDIEDGFVTGADVIDASESVVIPGLVDCHTHQYALGLRGAPIEASPRSFYEALTDIWWEVDVAFTERDAELTALGSCIEMLESGVTTFCDNFSGPNTIDGGLSGVAAGVGATPIRGTISFEATARDTVEDGMAGVGENRRFIREEEGQYEHVTGHYCLHTLFTNTPAIIDECVSSALEDDRPIQLHLSEGLVDVHDAIGEYGCRPVEALAELGLFDARVIGAHCVHVTPEELDVLAENDVGIAHNPYSNTNNAVGIADVESMRERDMTIGLGTDGWDPDLFETMRTAAGIHRLKDNDPSGFDPALALEWATIGSAAVLGMDDIIGSIEPGKRADFVTLDLGPTPVRPDSAPGYVVSAGSTAVVERTIREGQVVYDESDGVRGVTPADNNRITAGTRDLWERL